MRKDENFRGALSRLAHGPHRLERLGVSLLCFDFRRDVCHDIGRGVGLKAMEKIGPGEYSYAVAVREGARLWLTLWVKLEQKWRILCLSVPIRSDVENPAH